FDLGRVLIHFDFKRGYRALEGLCPYSAAEIPKKLAGTGLVERFETGLMEPRAFVEEISRILELRVDYERFCEIWSCIFTHELLPESMLEGLKHRYRMVLLSNTNALHFEMLRGTYSHLLQHFDELILSYEVQAMKPHEEIFRAAVTAAQCRPEECFYTDDIAAYIEGAQKLGIDAVQFESREQIEREMRARGIVWE
ncbi:MAG: HAD-superfamily hydrolase, subfamily variant 3, partial [Candidatus Solibacter sp.]|nr:HAD-superfamily hydrolase, subfamily variant 3 [Candidatus Solibacter sp.]